MTPEYFLQRLDTLIEEDNWPGVLDWYDAHYPFVRSRLSEEERDSVEGGAVHTATVVLEARRRRLLAEEAAERELTAGA